MKCRDKVMYLNRPAYIVGVRQPRLNESGRFFDLSRKPDSSKIHFKDIPEKYLLPLEAAVVPCDTASSFCVAQNGWARRVEFPVLVKA